MTDQTSWTLPLQGELGMKVNWPTPWGEAAMSPSFSKWGLAS